MEMEKILEMMAAQRHEFVNHLQVISGLIQMGQQHRVPDYVVKVSQVIKGLSMVGQLKLPDVQGVLLNAYYLGAAVQVEVKYNLQTDLARCSVPDQKMARVLEEVIDQILAGVIPTTDRQFTLHIGINNADKDGYLCLLNCSGLFLIDQVQRSLTFNEAKKELSHYGGELTWLWTQEKIEITLLLPTKP